MSGPDIDRNVALGVLALQMRFITDEQLIAALKAWVVQKDQPLEQLLLEQGAVSPDTPALLSAVVKQHVSMHDGEARQSLLELVSDVSLPEELDSIDDHDLATTLTVLAARKPPRVEPESVSAMSELGSHAERFRKLREHAEGGLGVVSLARDNELSREVALKEIQERHADDQNSRDRFVLEAKITGGLEHPGIVPVYGLGKYNDGRPYYAMRFIRGNSLGKAVARFHKTDKKDSNGGDRTFELRKLLGRFIDVCNAIEYAHSRGILHRDLKPGNIMLGDYGETLVVDWGLAKEFGNHRGLKDGAHDRPWSQSHGMSGTRHGDAVGTPGFMSPEQVSGDLVNLGPASDVYSLGATMYQLMTGTVPISGRDLKSIVHDVCTGNFVKPRVVDRRIPKPLEAICLKAMSLAPGDRYESPKAMSDDLECWLADEPVQAYPEPLSARAWRWVRHHRAQVISGVVAGLIAVCSLAAIVAVVTSANRQLATTNGLLDTANGKLSDQNEQLAKAELQARTEAGIATAINDFLRYDLLGQASPEQEQDPTITLRVVLDRASDGIEGQFLDQPLVEAAIRQTIGDSYKALGEYDKALEHLQRAYDLNRQEQGDEGQETLVSMNNLAALFLLMARFDEAETLFKKTLEARIRLVGEEHEDTLTTLNNLAAVYHAKGQNDKAFSMLERALASKRRVLGDDDPNTLTGMHNLAGMYYGQGQIEKAASLFETTLQAKQQVQGEDHPDTLASMLFLATVQAAQGRYEEAERLHTDAMERFNRVLGEEHPSTLACRSYLAQLYIQQSRYQEAETLLQKTLQAAHRALEENHPSTLGYMILLGGVHNELGRYDEAERLFRDALARHRLILGDEHPGTLSAMGNLAVICESQGKYKEAERLHQETLDIRQRVLGEEHPSTVGSLNNLGLLYEAIGRYADAERLHAESLRLHRKIYGDEHPDTLTSMNNLGLLYDSLGRYQEAEELLARALDVSRRVLGDEHADTLGSMTNLASVYHSTDRHEQAKRLYEESLASYLHVLGEEHPNTLSTMHNLALLYQDVGRLDEAEQLHQRELSISRRALGDEHPQTLASINALAGLYYEVGRLDEADPMLTSNLEARRRLLGEEHPDTLESIQNLATLRAAQNRGEEAEALFVQVGQLTRRTLGDTHPFTQAAIENLATFYVKQRRYKTAELLIQELVDLARTATAAPRLANTLARLCGVQLEQAKFAAAEVAGRQYLKVCDEEEFDDWRLSHAKCLIGAALAGADKFDDATPLILDGSRNFDQWADVLPPAHQIHVATILRQIVRLHTSSRQPGEASKWHSVLDKWRPTEDKSPNADNPGADVPGGDVLKELRKTVGDNSLAR